MNYRYCRMLQAPCRMCKILRPVHHVDHAAPANETKTGHGLSREALEWLRSYLMAAVVEA